MIVPTGLIVFAMAMIVSYVAGDLIGQGICEGNVAKGVIGSFLFLLALYGSVIV